LAWALPLSSWRVSSPWGRRASGFHKGLDLAAPRGSRIGSVEAGTVLKIWVDNGNKKDPKNRNGNGVRILHVDGTGAGYAHMDTLAPGLAPGVKVAKGQALGTVGDTGASSGDHLHLTAFDKNGVRVNPANFLPNIFKPAEKQAAGVLFALLAAGLSAAAVLAQRKGRQ
jgi:murein DD-endopeptidase MepM/ murein hydrolase activator NlpD